MTDLHCHILPELDDGASDVETAIELLKQEKKQGVRRIIFTPHFDCTKCSLEEFLIARQKSFDLLMSALPEELKKWFEFKLGAEVFFSPALKGLDIEKLCITGTRYLLLELPFNKKPQFLRETIYDFTNKGIVPIIAHIERYGYAFNDPALLYEWINAGYYIQVNSEAISIERRTIKKYFSWGLVQLVASDAHSTNQRPVDFEGLSKIDKETMLKLKDNSDVVFENGVIFVNPYCPKKTIFGWR